MKVFAGILVVLSVVVMVGAFALLNVGRLDGIFVALVACWIVGIAIVVAEVAPTVHRLKGSVDFASPGADETVVQQLQRGSHAN